MKSTDPSPMKTIRDLCSFEILKKITKITVWQTCTETHAALSVVIHSILPSYTDDEIQNELQQEWYTLIICVRIMCKECPTYMVRVLTKSQETVDNGAMI